MYYFWTTSYATNEPDVEVAEQDAREYFLELLSRPDWRDHLITYYESPEESEESTEEEE